MHRISTSDATQHVSRTERRWMSVNDMNLLDLQQRVGHGQVRTGSQTDMEPYEVVSSCAIKDGGEDDFFNVDAKSMKTNRGLPGKSNDRYRHNFQTGLRIQQDKLRMVYKAQTLADTV